MPGPRAVLFDLDGVLVNSYEAWFKLVNLATRHFCKSDVERDRFHDCWGQGIEVDLREFFPGCNAAEIERFYDEHLLDFDSCIEADADAAATLQRLRDEEIARAVVTNTPTPLARDILALTGLIGLVDLTVGAMSDLASKPAPDLIVHACRELDVEPAETLVVGDSRFDEEAARAANAPFVGFRTEDGHGVSTLPDLVDRVLSQLGS
ncbi:MAG: HAD family hydrolase [Candidatus Latescibacterota bacterium]|nr:MAG: HAD family hydrolase [Candidatus Latescibacterota bacterium]